LTARSAVTLRSQIGERSGSSGSLSLDENAKLKERMKKIVLIAITALALSATSLLARDPKALYEDQCAKCHGLDGKGQTKMGQKLGAKDYTDAKVQAALTEDAAFKAIKDGFKDKDGKALMKPTEDVSDDDAKALVVYMRTFKK
jgi:cytochrome c551/c552